MVETALDDPLEIVCPGTLVSMGIFDGICPFPGIFLTLSKNAYTKFYARPIIIKHLPSIMEAADFVGIAYLILYQIKCVLHKKEYLPL